MTTEINSLAPETLARIFELATEVDKHSVGFLRATSLVCQAWRYESQAQLWRNIHISNGMELEFSFGSCRILDSPALGRFATVKATFSMTRELPLRNATKVITRIVKSLHGLRELSFVGVTDLPASLFLIENLIGLVSLDITNTSLVDLAHPAALLPFHLRSLRFISSDHRPPTLAPRSNPEAPNFFKALLATSILEALAVALVGWPGELEGLAESLPRFAATLRKIELAKPGRTQVQPEAFVAFTSLRHITLNSPDTEDFRQILQTVPFSLHHLRIKRDKRNVEDAASLRTGQLIIDGLPMRVLISLRVLELVDFTEPFTRLEENGLVAACAARGVELRYGGDLG